MRAAHSATVSFLCVFSVGTVAQDSSARAEDEAAIRQVVQAFIDTRDADDADSLRAVLTEDVDQQVTAGRMRTGREEVVSGSLATTTETGGERTIVVEKIRFLSEEIAIIDGSYDIVGRREGPDRHYRTSMVLKKDGAAWRITAIRNMQPTQ